MAAHIPAKSYGVARAPLFKRHLVKVSHPRDFQFVLPGRAERGTESHIYLRDMRRVDTRRTQEGIQGGLRSGKICANLFL